MCLSIFFKFKKFTLYEELIENAKCGFFAEPENIDEIHKVVLKFLNLKLKDRKILGENGYEYGKTHFDRIKLAKKYIKEINSCANEK